MAGTAAVVFVSLLFVLMIHSSVCDYDLEYYPEPNYDLEFISSADHVDADHELDHIPDHDHELDHEPEPSQDHETALPPHVDDPHPEQVRDKWERRVGDVVEGGYTVLEADGTVHHVRYTEKPRGQGTGQGAAQEVTQGSANSGE